MLRYETKTKHGLVALYDNWPGNGAGPFLQAWSPHGAVVIVTVVVVVVIVVVVVVMGTSWSHFIST